MLKLISNVNECQPLLSGASTSSDQVYQPNAAAAAAAVGSTER